MVPGNLQSSQQEAFECVWPWNCWAYEIGLQRLTPVSWFLLGVWFFQPYFSFGGVECFMKA